MAFVLNAYAVIDSISILSVPRGFAMLFIVILVLISLAVFDLQVFSKHVDM